MQITRKVTDDITWVGASDRRLSRFENLFPISRGVSYNSYVINDEKTALMDTADASVREQFLENVKYALSGKDLDYIVVDHMEPDHCSMIVDILKLYPKAVMVGNAKTFQFFGQMYSEDIEGRTLVVKEGDKLSLGKHELTFVMAPMVHWPEAMVSYDSYEKVLFSADAFGTFGALNGALFNDEVNFENEWLDDARRYYTNIVGKYGMPVQTLLKKAAGLDISFICPLHGPVWRSDIAWFIDKYSKWSAYKPEEERVLIIYGSMYGNTEAVADKLAAELSELGEKNIEVFDASNTDVSVLVSESFKCDRIVIASPTYNGGIYPSIENYLNHISALALQGRKVAIIENGTWAPMAGKQISEKLSAMKNMTVLEKMITVKSSANETVCNDILELARTLRR